MNKLLFLAAVILTFFGFFLLYLDMDSNKQIIKKIRQGYRGKIVEFYSPVKRSDEHTHVVIRTGKDSLINVRLRPDIINYASLGDSIIKLPEDNFVLIKKSDQQSKEFYYVRITDEVRDHWSFPDEWRERWMEPVDR